jgi:hypothetical protein
MLKMHGRILKYIILGWKYAGFELPLVACCGYGGKYNYSDSVGCGGTITVNGSQIFVGSCESPSVRVNWDGEVTTPRLLTSLFSTKFQLGAFSDPPIPLKMACHHIWKIDLKYCHYYIVFNCYTPFTALPQTNRVKPAKSSWCHQLIEITTILSWLLAIRVINIKVYMKFVCSSKSIFLKLFDTYKNKIFLQIRLIFFFFNLFIKQTYIIGTRDC